MFFLASLRFSPQQMDGRKKKKLIRMFNVMLPLSVGLLIYLTYRPEAMVTRAFAWILPFTVGGKEANSMTERLLCNYGTDILWAYSLTFYVMCWFQRMGKSKRAAIRLCLLTELIVELLQLLEVVKATFDPLDIVVECGATILIFLIAQFKRRKN